MVCTDGRTVQTITDIWPTKSNLTGKDSIYCYVRPGGRTINDLFDRGIFPRRGVWRTAYTQS